MQQNIYNHELQDICEFPRGNLRYGAYDYDVKNDVITIGVGGMIEIKTVEQMKKGSYNYMVIVCSDKILTKYVYHYLKTHAQKIMKNYTINQLIIDKRALKSLMIPVPSIECQMAIVERIEKEENIIHQYNMMINKSRENINSAINNITQMCTFELNKNTILNRK